MADLISASPMSTVFFFFQAEDGIRDLTVTGVQTCALPICPGAAHSTSSFITVAPGRRVRCAKSAGHGPRSEERRVGKECRLWWSVERKKHKMPREAAISPTPNNIEMAPPAIAKARQPAIAT